ncbi:hypothetical protein PSHT_10312 [Puccinia striiformis]|uniref:Uncharacterized protein n=1 Tax=Puccinia striiformis TaxID=27350 RepID=A0A2S4VAD7_9BASI|nr:hypothetical protein PSHT_10312 [Puccinia striiformis]
MNHSSSSKINSTDKSWPLIDQQEPAPPYHPLSENSALQASLTTFPSRLRLGTSTLAQPIYTNTYIQNRLQRPNSPIENSHASISTSIPLSEPGKRVRRVVNYSENDSSRLSTIDPDLEAAFEDDHPRSKPNATRGRPSHSSRLSTNANVNQTTISGRNSTPTPVNSSSSDPSKAQEDELNKRKYADGRSYLAQDPPAKFIRVERKIKRAPLLINTLALSENDQPSPSSDNVCLVPIRIELDTDELRIRDVFTWNLRERFITPEIFALEFCADAGIQPGLYVPKIVEQIKAQLSQYSFLSATKLVPDESELSHFSDEQLVGIEPDLRVVIQLDVQIETLHLSDRIEWDLASPLTPELFTAQYICDLNLPRSASPIIAHAIHEEICRYKRDCLSLGLVSEENLQQSSSTTVPTETDPTTTTTGTTPTLGTTGTTAGATTTTTIPTPTPNLPIGIVQSSFKIETDPLLKEKYGSSRGPRKLEGVWRDWHEANLFGPKIQFIHTEDLEWNEIEKDRLARSMKSVLNRSILIRQRVRPP